MLDGKKHQDEGISIQLHDSAHILSYCAHATMMIMLVMRVIIIVVVQPVPPCASPSTATTYVRIYLHPTHATSCSSSPRPTTPSSGEAPAQGATPYTYTPRIGNYSTVSRAMQIYNNMFTSETCP